MTQKKMLLLFNPRSGKGEFAPQLFDVVDHFTKAGFEVTVHPTQAPKDANNVILARAGDFDYLCCSGGDGMVSEAINAIMALEKRPVFGYIPSGTTNDFATTLKIPKDIIQAANVVTGGIPCEIDVGCFGDKHFAYVAAFGLFTDVTYGTPQDIKNMIGHAAYILEGVKRLGSIKAYHCDLDIDGEKLSGSFIFGMASNTISVGGVKMHPETNIQLDDGLFEMLLIKRPKSLVDLQNIIASMMNREAYTESLIVRQASNIRIVSKTPLDWTLDGEYGGSVTDITIKNKKRAFEIIAPKAEITVG